MAGMKCKGLTFRDFVYGVCACLNVALTLSVLISLNALFTDWLHAFGAGRGQTSVVQATCVGVTHGAAVVAGILEGKLGERVSLLLGTALASAGFLAGGFVTSLPALIVCVGVVTGSGFCLMYLSTLSTVLRRFPKKAGFMSSAMSCSTGLANLGTPLFFRYLSEQYTWRGCLVLTAGILLNSAIFSLLLTSPLLHSTPSKPDTRKSEEATFLPSVNTDTEDKNVCHASPHKEPSDTEEDHSPEDRKSCFSRFKSNAAFITDPLYVCVTLCTVMSFSTIFCFIVLVLDFATHKGWSVRDGIFLNFMFQLLGLLSRAVVGVVSLHKRVRSIALLIVSGMVSGVGVCSVGQVSTISLAALFYACIGAGLGGVASMFPAAVLEVTGPGPSYPVALGLMGTVEGIMEAVASTLAGFLVDALQSYSIISLVYGLVCLSASLSLLFVSLCRNRSGCGPTMTSLPTGHRVSLPPGPEGD